MPETTASNLKITVGVLASKPFQTGLAKLLATPLPARLAYRVKKTVDKLRSEFRDYEAARVSCVKKWGRKDEGAETWRVDQSDWKAFSMFQADIADLYAEEIELPFTEKLKLSELGGTWTADELSALDCLVDGD